jgi:hypothetical protein
VTDDVGGVQGSLNSGDTTDDTRRCCRAPPRQTR